MPTRCAPVASLSERPSAKLALRRAVPWAVLVGVATLAVVAPAHAQCAAEGSWVAVRFRGDAWDARVREAVMADLRAGLRQRDIGACSSYEGAGEPALARVEITRTGPDGARVEVLDTVTDKRVSRQVDLQRIPADSQPLALAVAAEELLRASWAELALRARPSTPDAPPPAPARVDEAVAEWMAAESQRPARFQVGLSFAGDYYHGGQTQLGVDLGVSYWLAARLGARVHAGLRQGLRERAPDGEVESRALGAGAGGLVAIVPRSARFDLLASLGVSALRVTLQGVADDDAFDGTGSAWAVYARAGLSMHWRVAAPLQLEMGAGVGLPLRSVRASDSGTVVSGVSGVALSARAGVGVAF